MSIGWKHRDVACFRPTDRSRSNDRPGRRFSRAACPVFNNFHPSRSGLIFTKTVPYDAKCNGDVALRVLPGEIEIARPKNAFAFTCFYGRRCRRRVSVLNFSAGTAVYRGRRYYPEPRASSTSRPRRHFYGRAGIRVRRRKITPLSLSRRRGGAVCRMSMRFSAGGTPSWGPAYCVY